MTAPMASWQRRFDLWCCAAVFLGSFLLFQVQPMISKMILPWFGGSPAVWTTCMLFFQLLLLGGYAYADWLARRQQERQWHWHIPLLALAAVLLPITPRAAWKPTGSEHSTWAILGLLSAHVGLPYLLLASNAPLVQTWFARAYPDRSPYRLYALSNTGSLVALLSYPVLVEPWLSTNWQGYVWSGGFGLFAAVLVGMLLTIRKMPGPVEPRADEKALPSLERGKGKRRQAGAPRPVKPPPETALRATTWFDCAVWVGFAALASAMLLATTHFVCQDLAVVPFLWIVPLALYLVSFIICFEYEPFYVPRWWALILAMALLVLSNMQQGYQVDALWKEAFHFNPHFTAIRRSGILSGAAYFVVLFLISMVCHGEIVRRKPVVGRLTSFYLLIATGGALGGIFVALICPRIFSATLELPIGLVLAYLVSIVVLLRDGGAWFADSRLMKYLVMVMASVGALVMAWAFIQWSPAYGAEWKLVDMVRNFYGVLAIREYYPPEMYADRPQDYRPQDRGLSLNNGSTLHGFQFASEELRGVGTTYYAEGSGVETAIRAKGESGPIRVGVVGLGAGTVAAYARSEDYVRFYEINPDVMRIAETYFSFLKDARERGATVELALGDARLSLEREPDQRFDVLVLDAFSSDAIPTHLLTREAFTVYLRHLAPEGIIAIHVSNRYLHLEPVVVGVAQEHQMETREIQHVSPERHAAAIANSDWVLAARETSSLETPTISQLASPVFMNGQPPRLWTDRHSNLLQIIKWKLEWD